MIIVQLFLVTIINSHAFLFFEAETKEGFDLAKGSVLTSMFLEEAANIEDNEGISLIELENALSRHDADANRVIGNGRTIESEYLNLTSTQYLQNSKRKAANNIRKTSRLIKALCALGPESCTAANAHLMLSEQRHTNDLLVEQQKIEKLKAIREENEKIKKTEATVTTLKSIESLPLNFLEKLNKAIK